jgi:hypothetical protein
MKLEERERRRSVQGMLNACMLVLHRICEKLSQPVCGGLSFISHFGLMSPECFVLRAILVLSTDLCASVNNLENRRREIHEKA